MQIEEISKHFCTFSWVCRLRDSIFLRLYIGIPVLSQYSCPVFATLQIRNRSMIFSKDESEAETHNPTITNPVEYKYYGDFCFVLSQASASLCIVLSFQVHKNGTILLRQASANNSLGPVFSIASFQKILPNNYASIVLLPNSTSNSKSSCFYCRLQAAVSRTTGAQASQQAAAPQHH